MGCRWWLEEEQGGLRKEMENEGEDVLVYIHFEGLE